MWWSAGDGLDLVVLQGNYAGLTLGAHSLDNVEYLSVLTHGNSAWGGGGVSPFHYTVATVDANVAAGRTLTINASTLDVDESLNFDGHNETDGNFLVYSGRGSDQLTGGSGVDTVSYYYANGVTVSLALETPQDTVGSGTDTLVGFENIIGSAYDDTLTGNNGNDVVEGGDGNDCWTAAPESTPSPMRCGRRPSP